jgi:CHAT domain-containing protein
MRDGASSSDLATINYASLSYLLTRDTLIVWVTQPSGAVHHAAIPISTDSVSGLVEDARMAIDARSAQTGIRRGGFGESKSSKRRPVAVDVALRRIANLVLPTQLRRFLPDTGNELVIIPSGALGLVPFAALPLGREPLGIRYAIRYAPSFATLAVADNEAAKRPDPRLTGWAHSVVVGDPLMPTAHEPDGRSLGFEPLSDARTEATWLADSLRVQPLIGQSATEDSVTALMPNAPLIHLATHGLAYDRDDRARASFVVLASGRNADGLLTVGEILDDRRPLRASLVVLSACETALGDVKQSEGTVGLQRAFLARKASSVLVSLWSVSDEATALLMRRFYERWLYDKNRLSKAQALRLAERDVSDALGKDHPEFWAGFQLVGAR